jgi:SPX domain protein involved in polyphosphate accumulation
MQKNMRLEKDLDEVQRLFLSGQKDLAFKRIDKIVKKYDKYYLPYNYRGIILLASKKFDLALADFKKVVS